MVLTITFLAGLFQLSLGVARLGALVNFVSHSVVVGFTAGAALLIGTSQLSNFLGVPGSKRHAFIHVWADLAQHLSVINPVVIAIAAATLAFALLFKRFLPKLPGMLFAMVIGSLLSLVLNGKEHGVRLLGSLPAHLPPFSMPDLSTQNIRSLAPAALAVAMLGLAEAVSIARAVATRSHQRIDSNQEFIGQGLANIVGSFFSSYASSGSFTRTGVNFDAGARTPLAAVFAAAALLLILLLIAPLTAYLPIPAMAGVLLLVAWNLIDFHHIAMIIRTSRSGGRGACGHLPCHAFRGTGVCDLCRRHALAPALPEPDIPSRVRDARSRASETIISASSISNGRTCPNVPSSRSCAWTGRSSSAP